MYSKPFDIKVAQTDLEQFIDPVAIYQTVGIIIRD